MYDLNLKCDNFEVCEAILPDWWFECKGNYLCCNCHMMFGSWTERSGKEHLGKGTLQFYDNLECPICLENTRCVSQPRCNHSVCVNCFKRCYYGKEYPLFPYAELEQEYYDDVENNNYADNSKWDDYRHNIDEYDLLCDKIENENCNEKIINKCPLCRK
jgi:hypothetical protein